MHDGWQVVLSLKNGKVVDRYLWGARQDELLCENDGFVLADHLGSVRKVVDAEGDVVSSLKYSAFGEVALCTGMLPRFRYTGKLFDDVTGLQWNVNRWYDAKVGRWISEDPIGFRGKDVNLNRYVGNGTQVYIDLFGLVDSSNLIVKDAIIADFVSTKITLYSSYDRKKRTYTHTINLPYNGDLGMTAQREFHVWWKRFCERNGAGRTVWRIRFRVTGIAHAVVYPVGVVAANELAELDPRLLPLVGEHVADAGVFAPRELHLPAY